MSNVGQSGGRASLNSMNRNGQSGASVNVRNVPRNVRITVSVINARITSVSHFNAVMILTAG